MSPDGGIHLLPVTGQVAGGPVPVDDLSAELAGFEQLHRRLASLVRALATAARDDGGSLDEISARAIGPLFQRADSRLAPGVGAADLRAFLDGSDEAGPLGYSAPDPRSWASEELEDRVAEALAEWTALQDVLVAFVATLLDLRVEAGRPLQEVLDVLVAQASVPLDELVPGEVTASDVAALLRAHTTEGRVEVRDGAHHFVIQCGSGLRLWRRNPGEPVVGAGEVDGVPPGHPRYCARCIHQIAATGRGRWTVHPPEGPEGPCRWVVAPPDGS